MGALLQHASLYALPLAPAGTDPVTLAKLGKIKATAEDFESQFLGAMFGEMVSQLKGDGPLGDEGAGADAFRGLLTDELGRSVARAGGIGIAPSIYHELIRLQAAGDKT